MSATRAAESPSDTASADAPLANEWATSERIGPSASVTACTASAVSNVSPRSPSENPWAGRSNATKGSERSSNAAIRGDHSELSSCQPWTSRVAGPVPTRHAATAPCDVGTMTGSIPARGAASWGSPQRRGLHTRSSRVCTISSKLGSRAPGAKPSSTGITSFQHHARWLASLDGPPSLAPGGPGPATAARAWRTPRDPPAAVGAVSVAVGARGEQNRAQVGGETA